MVDTASESSPAPVALALTGPTAAGKSALAIMVAERLGGEIISMDSRQVYRGMDIGTAKASLEDQDRVPHHGLDIIDPDERYSAGRFSRDARRWISEIRDRGSVPILVGGTGFFLNSLTNPLFEQPELEPRRRARLNEVLDRQGTDTLRAWLIRKDPESAASLARGGGRQRLIRALEIALLTGKPLSWWHQNAPPEDPPLRILTFIINLPREDLYDRINRRVTEMLDAGLVAEVEGLLESGYEPDDPGMNAVGYREIIAYLQGNHTLEEAADLVRQNSRRYARRQLTWFRHQLPSATWLDASKPSEILVDRIVQEWTKEAP